MSRILAHTAAPLFAAIIGIFAAGCMPPATITPLPGSSVGSLIIEDINYPQEAQLLPDRAENTLTLVHKGNHGSIAVRHLSHELVQLWQHELNAEELATSVGINELNVRKHILRASPSTVDVIAIGSGRTAVEDSLYVIAVRLDKKDGNVVSVTSVDRRRLSGTESDQEFRITIDSTNTYAALTTEDRDATSDSLRIEGIVVNANYHPVYSFTHVFGQGDDRKSVRRTITIDEKGRTAVITLNNNRLAVTQRGIGMPPRSMQFTLPGISEDGSAFVRILAATPEPSLLSLRIPRYNNRALTGLAQCRIDLNRFDTLWTSYYALTPARLEALGMDAPFDDVFYTYDNLGSSRNGTQIAIFEQWDIDFNVRKNGLYRSTAGNILVLAFNADGTPTWQKLIKREEHTTTYQISDVLRANACVDERGNLRILYREGSQWMQRAIPLKGEPTMSDALPIAEFGTGTTLSTSTIVSLGPRTLYALGSSGNNGKVISLWQISLP